MPCRSEPIFDERAFWGGLPNMLHGHGHEFQIGSQSEWGMHGLHDDDNLGS
jgi:hypothetical protein